jgi:hypothetical protein
MTSFSRNSQQISAPIASEQNQLQQRTMLQLPSMHVLNKPDIAAV